MCTITSVMSNSLHRMTGRATILTSPIPTSFQCEARKSLTGRLIVTRPREQRYFLGTERDQWASSPPAHSLFAIQDPIRGLQRDPEAAWLTGVHASMDRGNEIPRKLCFPCTYSLGLLDQRLDRPDGYVRLVASALKRPRVVSINRAARAGAINPTLIAGGMSANLSAACSPRHRREVRLLDCL